MTFNQRQEKTACRQIVRILSSLPTEVSMEFIKMLIHGKFEGRVSLNYVGGFVETIALVTGRSREDTGMFVLDHLTADNGEYGEGLDALQDLFRNIHLGNKVAQDRDETGNLFAEIFHRCCMEALQKIEAPEAMRARAIVENPALPGVPIPVRG